MVKKKTPLCPCGTGQAYAQCCGRYIGGPELPATAEALMRSRYTAYTLLDSEYLLKTWHPSTRPRAFSLQEEAPIKWQDLTIEETCAGSFDDDQGTVQFVARYKVNGKAARMAENSHFRKEAGQWFYVSGEVG